jgi:Tol biopolymer transport system component
MRWLNDYKIKLVLVGFVAFIVLGYETSRADFIFGEPTNLGPTINTSTEDAGPSISADGLSLFFYTFFGSWESGGTLRVVTRENIEYPWGQAVNLGSPIYRGTAPCISADGLSLYFDGKGGGGADIFVSNRPSISDPWSNPVNLGPSVNAGSDMGASISSDGLELFFGSDRSGGSGDWDIYVTTRATVSDPWSTSVNLGPTVNSANFDGHPCISPDGLTLLFTSNRSGGYGDWDIWMSKRATRDDEWGTPVNLGPAINTEDGEGEPSISADGRTLYFSDWMAPRPGGVGNVDIWQIPIIPIVDLNGDGIVDCADMCIIVDYWGTDYSLCDIGPTPLGDGIVDVQDLIVLAEHLFEEVFPEELETYWKLNEVEGDIAHDSAGDNHGTLSGNPIWHPDGGQVAGALEFDGIDDYISTDNVLNPKLVEFSIFAWIKGGSPGQVIISQKNSFGGTGATWLGIDASDGRLITELTSTAADPLESESVITDDQWHHVGLVWDGSCRQLYVDGMQVTKDTVALTALKPSTGGMYIGVAKDRAQTSYFSGLIDDVRIYRRALSAEEIAAMAQ